MLFAYAGTNYRTEVLIDTIINSVEFVFVRLAADDGYKSCVEVNIIENLSIIRDSHLIPSI